MRDDAARSWLSPVPAWLLQTAVIFARGIVIAGGVWLFAEFFERLTVVVVPLLLALLVAAVMRPIVARLRHPRLPDWVVPLDVVGRSIPDDGAGLPVPQGRRQMWQLFDATAIAIGLAILGVPVLVTLAVLQFFGSYVPTSGAFVAGAVLWGMAGALLFVPLVAAASAAAPALREHRHPLEPEPSWH